MSDAQAPADDPDRSTTDSGYYSPTDRSHGPDPNGSAESIDMTADSSEEGGIDFNGEAVNNGHIGAPSMDDARASFDVNGSANGGGRDQQIAQAGTRQFEFRAWEPPSNTQDSRHPLYNSDPYIPRQQQQQQQPEQQPGPKRPSTHIPTGADGSPLPSVLQPSASPGISHQPYPPAGFSNGVGMNGFTSNGNGHGHGHGGRVHPPPQAYASSGSFGGPAFTLTKSHPKYATASHAGYSHSGHSSPVTATNSNGGPGAPLTFLPLSGANAGASMSSAIDLTSIRIPTPPPSHNPKQPLCIGAIASKAIMLYPSPAAVIGSVPIEGGKERHYEIREWRGAEFIKVKLKLRTAGSERRADAPGANHNIDMIQVTTPSLHTYVGDLDMQLASTLIHHMKRGLLRLEGWAQRIYSDAPQFEIRVNVLLFTLPSNIKYISDALVHNSFFLTDPVPPYEPHRHSEDPPYSNPHMGNEEVRQRFHQHYAQLSGIRYNGSGMFGSQMQMDKAKMVEVQRQQVEDVFKSMDKGAELGQSDPGPLIKTDLFPHQRRALTFLLEREGDTSSLKKCRKTHDKKEEKKRKKSGVKMEKSVSGSTNGDHDADTSVKEEDVPGGKKEKVKNEKWRSLWEPIQDEDGKVRRWRNKITQEKRRGKEVPDEGKGAILADDMGLGKTLSIVSLIAATRTSARKWAKSRTSDADDAAPEVKVKPEYSASGFKNRVFGMPDIDSETDTKPSAKKRKREAADEKNVAARQSRIQLRSRGNLLVCPMSTITNWEDQIKEHWNGKVEIVGGSGIHPKEVKPRRQNIVKRNGEPSSDEEDADYDLLRVYVYHGSAKISDPAFLSDFDVVITSYNTLALEYSRMSNVASTDETPVDTAENSDDDVVVLGDTSLGSRATRPEVEAEIKAAEVADKLRKAEAKKKGRPRVKSAESSALQAIDWFRIVLDEAHYIKTASTIASRAACYLAADRRIALTGTPIQNKIEDIWALFKFLRLEPVDQKDVFNEFIWNPCKQGNSVGVAKLQLVMRCCTLRRTKDSTAEDGKKILNLPPRHERQAWLELRTDEREVYDKRALALRDRVHALQATNELGKNYANILQEMLRLRQICNHVDLAMLGAVEEDYDGTVMDYQVAVQGIERAGLTLARAQSVVCFRKDGLGANCENCQCDYNDAFPSIGLGGVEDEKKTLKKLTHRPLLTKCLHIFCPKCFKDTVYPDYKPKMKAAPTRPCSACGIALKLPTDVIEVVPPDSEQAVEIAEQAPKRAARKKYVRPQGTTPDLSTKMTFLLNELMRYSRRNPNSSNYNPAAWDEQLDDEDEVEEMDAEGKPFVTKSIVFSQWTTMLDRIGDMLDYANIKYDRLDGTMTREDRARAMQALKCNKKIEVLLVSTRAGGVGLNLTTASRAYLVDPYWNPSVEAQAIDRIHRMGQTRPVTAIKLMVKDSIEKKLDEIQKKKASLANLSLKPMTRKELMDKKAEELASLFN